MKRHLALLLSIVFIFCLTACKKEYAVSNSEVVGSGLLTDSTVSDDTSADGTTAEPPSSAETSNPNKYYTFAESNEPIVSNSSDESSKPDTSSKPTSSSKPTTSSKPEENAPVTITVSENTSWVSLYKGENLKYGFTLIGENPSVVISLPSEVILSGDTTISNVTLKGSGTIIYANGHKLKIDSDVKSSSRSDRLTVYGGSKSSVLAKTDITLLGGYYRAVYGGGYNRSVGSTNVVFGGNANPEDNNDDSSSNISPCIVYGGGNNAGVTGTVNVTIKDNAVAKSLSGVGYGKNGADVNNSNIKIEGGMLMNVFGGSLNSDVSSLNVSITMTGGLVEAIFGGCQSKNMSGSIDIKLLGGDVSRRVYTGCYNDCDVGFFSDTWLTSCKVTGKTTLTIGPNAKLCTGTKLSYNNTPDMGIFCGSRYKNGFSEEKNTLIFIDGCYNKMIGHIGPSPKSSWNLCKSHHSSVIKQ